MSHHFDTQPLGSLTPGTQISVPLHQCSSLVMQAPTAILHQGIKHAKHATVHRPSNKCCGEATTELGLQKLWDLQSLVVMTAYIETLAQRFHTSVLLKRFQPSVKQVCAGHALGESLHTLHATFETYFRKKDMQIAPLPNTHKTSSQ